MEAKLKPNRRHLQINGDYCYYENQKDETAGIIILCPGCGKESALSFKTATIKTAPHPIWQWNNNKEKPTLTPSVNSKGCCEWHGYLKNGEWVK